MPKIAALLIALSTGVVLNGQPKAGQLNASQWLEDIRVLQRDLIAKHADVYHTVRPEALSGAFEGMKQRVPSLDARAIVVELARIVAMVSDGHTELQLLQPMVGFSRLPISMYLYKEGLFITAADSTLKDITAARVLRIGKVTADEAVALVSPLMAGDTPIEVRHAAPAYLASPDILFALGILASPDVVPVEVETRQGDRRTLELRPISKPSLVTMRSVARVAESLASSRPASYYWFARLPDTPVLYFQLNASMNQDDAPSLADVTRDFFRRVDTDKPDAIVLDVRNNNGGNVNRNRAWVQGIADRSAYHAKGRLFVIVGRRTFSAGVDVVTELKKVAQPIIVGESPRGLEGKPGNRETFTLPNSRIVIDYSQKIDSTVFRGPKTPMHVDLHAPPTFSAAIAGHDVAMEAVLRAIAAK